MFQRAMQYEVIEAGGRSFWPRAYGEPQPDGTWQGWVVFFSGGDAIAPPNPETTQVTWGALLTWASGLTRTYLEGALERALRVIEQPPLISNLSAAEFAALDDAQRLEAAAEVARSTAKLDETAASMARADAESLREDRLAAEDAIAATEEAAATREAKVHEQAARDARVVAAVAGERRRAARTATPPARKTAGRKKK